MSDAPEGSQGAETTVVPTGQGHAGDPDPARMVPMHHARRAALWAIGLSAAAVAGAALDHILFPARRFGTGLTDRSGMRFSCPMHPEVMSQQPGRCPSCGMALVAVRWDGAERACTDATQLAPDALRVADIGTAVAGFSRVARVIRVSGVLEDNPSRRYRVSAAVSGRIEALHLHQTGAPVRAGQPLFDLYSPALLTAIRRQTALRKLVRTPAPDGVPSLTIEQQRMLDGGDQQLLLMGLTQAQCDALADAPPNPVRTTLLSPASGTVEAIHIQAGATVREGDALFDIGDLATMTFGFEVYEEELGSMAPGQSIRVRSTAFPDAPLVGVLGSLPVEVDPATRMAKLRAMVRIVHEEHHPLRPAINHASASAEIEVPGPEALTVPRSAVLDSGGGPLVYLVLASGRFLPRTVRLGRAGDTLWEVVGGLKAGDRVVTRGAVLVDAQARLHQGAGAMGAAQ